MSRGKVLLTLGVAVAAMVLAVGQALSQETQQGGRGGRRGAQNVDQQPTDDRAQQFRQRAEERMKTALGVTDEEWKALQPKIEKVTTLNRELRGGGMGMMGRGGRAPGGAAAAAATQAPQSEVQKQRAALQKVLDNKDAKPAEIKTALSGYRDARAKTRAELEKAQKDLRGVVTVRQEAQLVMMGTLE